MKLKIMFIFLIVMAVLLVAAVVILNQPVFGKAPQGERLERLKLSPQYKDGQFENLSYTPALAEGYSMPKVMFDFLFGKKDSLLIPNHSISTEKIDLKNLDLKENAMIWMGHSSYLLVLDGKTFLIDPVLSGYGAPFSFMNKAFKGTDVYTPEDLPQIDFLVITHDHYDHLDYHTITEIKDKVKQVILPLGVGSHFEFWGYDKSKLIEEDWYTEKDLADGFKITFTPARHFSGRLFNRNNTLWSSYVLQTPSQNIYLGGDSGYDTHFKMIGEKYGSFDFAILENGQYNVAWHNIHCLPDEVVQAGLDLNAKRVIPVHFGKFALAKHSWNEPIIKVDSLAREKGLSIATPKIGQKLVLDNQKIMPNNWWVD